MKRLILALPYFASFVCLAVAVFMFFRQQRWSELYYSRGISEARFDLNVLQKLRNGETNNLLPYIETRMLGLATELIQEDVFRSFNLQSDTNLLKEIHGYALTNNIFETHKGLLSHEVARKALEQNIYDGAGNQRK